MPSSVYEQPGPKAAAAGVAGSTSPADSRAPTPDEDVFGFAPAAQRRLHVNGRQFHHYKRVAERRQRSSVLLLPVLDPLGSAALLYSVLIALFDVSYTAFLVPLGIGFESSWTGTGFLTVANWVGSAIYLFDLLMGFQIGLLVVWDARWLKITDGRVVAWYYVREGVFAVNLVACVPMFAQIYFLATGDRQVQLLHLIYLLRLLRLFRVMKLVRSLAQPGAKSFLARFLQKWLQRPTLLVLNAFFSLCVMINLLACLWWTVAEAEGLPNSWAAYIEGKDVDLLTANDSTRWLYSVYFVLTTVTTLGYGDILPYTTVEVGISLVYMLAGVALFGFLINVVAEVIAVSQPDKRSAALHDNMQMLESWMTDRQLPLWLKTRLREYFMRLWLEGRDQEEATLYSALPPDLRSYVRQELQSHNLANLPLLKGLSPAARAKVLEVCARLAVPMSLFPGHHLYVKDHASHSLYILDEGRMSASSGPGWSDAVFSGPAVLNLSGLFAAHVPKCAHHSQTVTAESGCHLWRVDCAMFERELLHRHTSILQELCQMQLQRTKELLQCGSDLGWGTQESLKRESAALGRLQALAAGLEKHLATLAAAAEQQQKQAAEEQAEQKQVLEHDSLQHPQQAGDAAVAAAASAGSVPPLTASAQPAAGSGGHHIFSWLSSPSKAASGTQQGSAPPSQPVPRNGSSVQLAATAQLAPDTFAPGLRPPDGGFLVSASRRSLLLQMELYDVLTTNGKG